MKKITSYLDQTNVISAKISHLYLNIEELRVWKKRVNFSSQSPSFFTLAVSELQMLAKSKRTSKKQTRFTSTVAFLYYNFRNKPFRMSSFFSFLPCSS